MGRRRRQQYSLRAVNGGCETYAEVAGPHHAINWQGTFGDGLIALLGSKQETAR
jgi:hypothetical protein